MPQISVIMPVYNTEEDFLREAIESILNQTFADFEFLIINDGSTNNSEEVVLSYNDERIKYIKNEQNLGLIKTLNKGLLLAQGKYIARMDSDDISLPERFSKQSDFLDKNPDIDILGTWFNCFPKNRVVKTFTDDKQIKECMLINSNNIGHPSVMLRKSTIDKFDIKYDETALYVEDYALWLSLIDKVKFANLPEILLDYRMHENSICKTKNEEQSLNVQKIMTEAQAKYFGLDCESVLNTIEKLKNDRIITSSEVNEFGTFAFNVMKKAKEQKFSCEYDVNKDFYKNAIKRCKKDFLFLKILWTSPLNKILRLHLDFKIYNSIRCTGREREKEIVYNAKSPKISVVMALYNTPYKYLNKTVKSILQQTYNDFELIVIDDASTIQYKDFFEKINDERIKYFKLEKNSGPGHARNVGIEKAIGEYVAIVDSDDIYMQKKLELQVDFLDKNPDISLISGVLRFSNNRKISSVLEEDKDIKAFMLFNSALTNAAVMFRKNVFLEKNLFYTESINFGEDYHLWIKAMFAGVKMANLKEILMIYVRRANQLSKTRTDKQASILKDLYKEIFSYMNLEYSQKELDLHYQIYTNKFNGVTEKEISDWFDKIIEQNKTVQIFDEQKITDKKNQTLESYNKIKNLVFKLKLLEYNLCIYKPLKIALEKRA